MEEEIIQLREYWLRCASVFLIEHMARCGLVPVVVRVSCGWPSRGGLGQRQAVIGQCFGPQACADGIPQIFISPRLAESVEVLGVLLHELVHASVGVQQKHLAPFSQAARKVGLAGPPTATVVGPSLRPLLQQYVAQVGAYPMRRLCHRSETRWGVVYACMSVRVSLRSRCVWHVIPFRRSV
jgi:hypothetical protein